MVLWITFVCVDLMSECVLLEWNFGELDKRLSMGSLTANFERLLRNTSTAACLQTLRGFSANLARLLRKLRDLIGVTA